MLSNVTHKDSLIEVSIPNNINSIPSTNDLTISTLTNFKKSIDLSTDQITQIKSKSILQKQKYSSMCIIEAVEKFKNAPIRRRCNVTLSQNIEVT